MTQPPGPPQPGQPPAQFGPPAQQPGPPQYTPQGQPPSQPPPYGQQQPYGQQRPYGQQPTYAPPSSRPVSVGGAIFVLLGAVGIGLAFTGLNWYHSDKGEFAKPAASLSTFSKIHKALAAYAGSGDNRASLGVSDLYFSWLGWVLAGAAVVLGVVAISQLGTRTPMLKLVAALVAAAGIGITAWAIRVISINGTPSYTEYLKHTSFGAWAAVAGFLLILIGSLIPARRG